MSVLLITGGCGFIGSHLVEKLTPKFDQVIVIDNLSTGYLHNIQPFLDKYQNLKYHYCDISNLNNLKTIFQLYKITHISHQAALGSVPRSVNDPLSSHQHNVNGFLNVLLCANEFKVKRIVYASSSSVYGDEENLPKKEEKTGNLLSPYAVTKKIDELYAKVFYQCYGLETIGFRYFNVFGKRQDPNGAYAAVIPKFINLMKQNQDVIINGNPKISRDFTFIDNVIEANYLALTTNNKDIFGEAVNICAGGRITLEELVDILKKELNSHSKIIIGEPRKGDIQHSFGDYSKASLLLNYHPKIDFYHGIKLLLI
jgi:UDP-N-acetylglucosamine 4-epimerase